MRLDITQNSKDHTYLLKIKIDQLKTLKDYETLMNLINSLSLEFDLDPEMSLDDLKKIAQEAKNEEADELNCSIGTEGIDLEF